MADYYVYADFETTGLDPADCTLLELGWSVFDARLVQLTPLRRRYTALRATGSPVVPTVSGPVMAWSGHRDDAPIEFVRDMHKRSGLHKDWCAAPAVSVLRSFADIDRLLIDDLVAAGWTGAKEDKVYLSGAGVSHFDHLVFKAHRSQLITENVLHYSAVDSSVTARTLGIESPKDALAMAAFADETFAEVGAEHMAWATQLETERGPLRSLSPNLTIDMFAFNSHRAPDDVAWSVLFSRLLRLRAGSPAVGFA